MINPKTITETIGTALLVFTIQVAVASGSDLAPFAIAAILISAVFAGGPVRYDD
jgi:glycerol uptake facilitator-like aquaporin